MSAGDVIAFSQLTLHGSGPNHTNEPHLTYAVQFHRDDFKATWDDHEPRLLKNSKRWNTSPLETLTAPNTASQDGH